MPEGAAARSREHRARLRREREKLKARIGQQVAVFAEDGETLWRVGVYAGMERYPGIGNTDYSKDPAFHGLNAKGQYVPRINLPDGTSVWGPECWWVFIDLQNAENALAGDEPMKTIEEVIE